MMRRNLQRLFAGLFKAQQTPNPDCISFILPDHYDPLVPEGVTCEASGVGYCAIHPVAYTLFQQYMRDVSAVFVAPRYVSVTKYYHVDWVVGSGGEEQYNGLSLTEKINSMLSEYVRNSDGPIPPDPDYLLVSSLADNDLAVDEEKDSELVQCVKDLLRMQIRPMIMQDGGDIRLLNVNEKSGVVSLHMLGACKSCPSSQNTLKNGIERVLKHFLPEITEVVEVKNPIVTITKEVTIPVVEEDASASARSKDAAYAAGASPVATKVLKTLDISPDDFEPVHKNEKSVFREIAKEDDRRRRELAAKKVRGRSAKGFMSYDELMEPDGD